MPSHVIAFQFSISPLRTDTQPAFATPLTIGTTVIPPAAPHPTPTPTHEFKQDDDNLVCSAGSFSCQTPPFFQFRTSRETTNCQRASRKPIVAKGTQQLWGGGGGGMSASELELELWANGNS